MANRSLANANTNSVRGKAQEIYASLEITDCADYSLAKAAILRSYEMVSETYREKFRSYQKKKKKKKKRETNLRRVFPPKGNIFRHVELS